MSEPQGERPQGQRMTTGEFRAMPDTSASTAEFQAFAGETGSPTGQWSLDAPRPKRIAVLVAVVVVLLAIIAILAAVLT